MLNGTCVLLQMFANGGERELSFTGGRGISFEIAQGIFVPRLPWAHCEVCGI
jgi:hypothetical protein